MECMKSLVLMTALLLVPALDFADPPKACEELKTEIAAKLDAKGVKNYSLTIVPNDKAGDGKVVGSCEGGTKKILYERK
jgi:Protein of unknown function (DUF1161)